MTTMYVDNANRLILEPGGSLCILLPSGTELNIEACSDYVSAVTDDGSAV